MGSIHEVNPSVWVTTAPPGTDYPGLVGDVEVDVAVVGGGITGLITAALLKEAGATVAVIEAGRLAAGATGYTTAKVTALHGLAYARITEDHGAAAAQAYAAANLEGLQIIARLVEAGGLGCDFERRSAYTYSIDPGRRADIEAEVLAARAAGVPAAFAEDTELPFTASAVRVDNQAQFHPRRFCLGVAAGIPGAGSHVFEHSRVTAVKDSNPTIVTCDRGTVRAPHVVLASHLPFLDRGLFFAKSWPQRSYAMALRPGPGSPAIEGMYLSADSPTRSLRSLPDGSFIVGGEGHKVGQEADTNGRYEALRAWAADELGATDVTHRWSAQDHCPVDGLPFVGRLRKRSSVLVATGFNKWGMTNGAAAARILTDLVTGADNPWAEVFDASRTGSLITSSALYKENANSVGKHLIGDRLRHLRPPTADSLAPGEGGIVELDGHKVAAFRDDDGGFHAVSPVCTHVGCLVAFNPAERTWDCPCHGSRFTTDGHVLEGPALKDLETKDLETKSGS